MLSAGAAQSLSVTFTPTDGANYTTATRSVAINVLKAPSTITLDDARRHRPRHRAPARPQLNATASVPGTFDYTPAPGSVLDAGARTLSVIFTPTDAVNYASATKSVTLAVTQVTPAIEWTTPYAIIYGTAINGAQLNATASTPGTFVYSPAAGTVLNAGDRTLSVTFTPSDRTNYTVTTARRDAHRAAGAADDHVGGTGQHRGRHPARRDAAERDVVDPGVFVYTPPAGAGCCRSAWHSR